MSVVSDTAKDKAARLLKKRASISSSTSNEHVAIKHPHTARMGGSVSTMSYADDHDNYGNSSRPPVRYENTYQLEPTKKFPQREVKYILKDVLDGYLAEEKYEPELCKQMTKTLSEVVKARIRDLQNVRSTRYKIVCIVHIGQLKDQAMQIGSRCLWDPANDSSTSYEFKNKSLFAIGSVFFVYNE